jgi:hypothetical protein
MSITSGAAVADFAVDNSSLSTQAEQTGNNTIVMVDDIQTSVGTQTNNGQVTGTDYIGRLIVKELGNAGEETRLVIGDAAGTGNLRILTVSEDWVAVPVITDTVHVFYNMNDCENVVTELNSRTGFYEMTNPIIVGDAATVAGLFVGFGDLIEVEDSKSTTVFHLEVQSLGRLQVGFLQGVTPVAGGLFLGINNAEAEAWVNFESGGEGRLYEANFIASLNPLKFQCDAGSDVQFNKFTVQQGTEECHLFDATLVDGSITGASTATEIVRVNAGTTSDGLTLLQTEGIQTANADTSTETIVLRNVIFIQNNNLIILEDNKTYDMVNPTWNATTNTDFDSALVAGSATINDQRSIDVIVQEADGTKLQDAVVNVYENTLLDDLVMEIVSAATTGLASGTFNYKDHIWTTGSGVTRTFGGHALQVGKWLYEPLVFTQVPTDFFDGTVVLASDANIVQTTQATAITAGSGVTWNGKGDTFPSCIIAYTGGTGTLSVGNTVTGGTSGAIGTVTEILSGDSIAGEVHLSTRTGAATFTNGEALTSTGWTGSPVYTASTQQDFSRWIDANSLSLQALYDYLAARMTETTLSADAELIWEWCRDTQAQPLYATGSSFFTERSTLLGLAIVNIGSGTLDYLTDDANVQWTPPASVTLNITVKNKNTLAAIVGVQTSIYLKDSPFTELMNEDTIAGGIASASYAGSTPVDVVWKCRKSDDLDNPRYKGASSIETITANGLEITVLLDSNPVLN